MSFHIRKVFIGSAVIVGIGLMLWTCDSKQIIKLMTEEEIQTFHQSLLTLDTHVDTPIPIKRHKLDLGERYNSREISSKLDFPRMHEGGLDAVFFAVWTSQGVRSDSGHAAIKQSALDIIDRIETSIAAYPDRAEIAHNSDDAQRLQNEQKYTIYLGMENGYPIGTELENLDLFYQRGIRYLTLCHMSNNEICDSSTDTSEFGGLSQFGFQIVKRMNQLGMMVDISHLSDASVEDVLNSSKAPVIASHSCAKVLCDHPRNISDSLIKQIARNGGVIQVNFVNEYVKTPVSYSERDSALADLDSKWGDRSALTNEQVGLYHKERAELNRKFPRLLPTVADVVNHIDHIVRLAGIDHVGIGSDFDGGGALQDCFDVSEMTNLTRELLIRGYSKTDIAKIWSGNLLRVFREVEQIADSLKQNI